MNSPGTASWFQLNEETSFFEQAFFPEELDRERSYDDNGEIIERDTLAAYGFCDWHAINVADPGPYYIVIDKPVNNHDVHDDDIMFDITQYLDMDKPDTTLTLEPPKEDVTMADGKAIQKMLLLFTISKWRIDSD